MRYICENVDLSQICGKVRALDEQSGRNMPYLSVELLELIVDNLDHRSLLHFRLTSKLSNECALRRIRPLLSSPSELIAEGTLSLSQEDYSVLYERRSKHVLAVWTWLTIPETLAEEQIFTKEFKQVLCAPTPAHHKGMPVAKGGRVGTCWGRMVENPRSIAIVTRKGPPCSNAADES